MPGLGSDPVISLAHVTKKFGELVVLEDVTFSADEAQIICLVGPSGCGKSTLLNLIAGFDFPSQGQLRVHNEAIERPGPDRAVVFQHDALFPWLTVWKNVIAGPSAKGSTGFEDKAKRLLAQMRLQDFHHAYPYQLSGGMRQRAAIARALMSDLQVLLMDEPFGALDAQTRSEMQSLLQEVWSSYRSTIIFITHDIEEALILGDWVYVMSARPGHILEAIQISFERPRTPELTTTPEFNDVKSHIMSLLGRGGSVREGPTPGKASPTPP